VNERRDQPPERERPSAPPDAAEIPTLSATGSAGESQAASLPAGLSPGALLGDYRLLREIGRGGMGVVFAAEQISIRRRVALKVLLPQLTLSTESVLKFQREAEAGGRQHHPGIVSVYAVGEYEGVHYIAQELVPGGETLADRLRAWRQVKPRLRRSRGDFEHLARLFAAVATALAHAHANGVVHRDVKPSNILIAPDGAPKVTDFGLAKVENALALTRTGDFEGTPYYMSPEQIDGRPAGIDHRTDIYSLGVALYEALALARPYEGDSSLAVVRRVLDGTARDPRQQEKTIPVDLAVIALKAIEREPHRRYATMGDMARDLERWLEGQTILARPAGIGLRAAKWSRRHRTITMSASAVLLFAAALAGAAAVRQWRVTAAFSAEVRRAEAAAATQDWSAALEHVVAALTLRPSDGTVQALRREYLNRRELAAVRHERDEKERALAVSEGMRLAAAAAMEREQDPARALRLALAATERLPALETRNAVSRALDACRERHTCQVRRHAFHPELRHYARSTMRFSRFSPDGRRFVTAFGDNRPRLWDGETGAWVADLAIRGLAGDARFTPDGATVLLYTTAREFRFFDAETGKPRGEPLPAHSGVRDWCSSPDGRYVATNEADQALHVYDLAARAECLRIAAHVGHGARNHDFHPREPWLAFVGADGQLAVWDVARGIERPALHAPHALAGVARFSPDGRHLAAASHAGTLDIWDLETGELRHQLQGEKTDLVEINEIAFSARGRFVSATWGHPQVRVWSVADGREVARLIGHEAGVRAVCFSPDERWVATSAFDRTARIWDLATGEERAVLRGHEAFLHDIAYSPDGSRLLTVSEDGTARLWDAAVEARREAYERGRTLALRFDPEGTPCPSGAYLSRDDDDLWMAIHVPGRDGATETKHTIRLTDSGDRFSGGRFSRDGQWVLLGTREGKPLEPGEIALHRVADGALVWRRPAKGSVSGAAFIDDDQRIVVATSQGALAVHDRATGAERKIIGGHEYWVFMAAFDPTETEIATASFDGTIRLWDYEAATCIGVLRGHEGPVWAVAYSPSGRHLVTASQDRTLRVWERESLTEWLTIPLAEDPRAATVGFSPDGCAAMLIAADGRMRSFPIDVVTEAARRAPRELSLAERQAWNVWGPGEARAFALVDSLYAELILPSRVVAHLQSATELSPDVRAAALRFAALEEENIPLWARWCDSTLRNLKATPERRVRAARVAAAIAPHASIDLAAHAGAAACATGDYERARRLLLEGVEEPVTAEALPFWRATYLVQADCHLGRIDEARLGLRRVRGEEGAPRPGGYQGEWLAMLEALVAEAEVGALREVP